MSAGSVTPARPVTPGAPGELSDVHAVIVAYNSAPELQQFAAMVAGCVRTLVVDNGSADRSVAVAQQLGASVLPLPANVGYGAAVNRGVRQLPDDVDHVLVLNPDVRITADVVAGLRRLLATRSEIGLVAPPQTATGHICTRSFIPHECHASIGVFAAVTVATACVLPGSPAASVAKLPAGPVKVMSVEHPTGEFTVRLEVDETGNQPVVQRAGLLRTARALFDGRVFLRSAA